MTCIVEDCEKEQIATGLCGVHYQRKRRTGSLETKKTLVETDPNGRECSNCQEYKPWSEYYKVRNGFFSQCKPCYKAYQKDRRAARRGQEGA